MRSSKQNVRFAQAKQENSRENSIISVTQISGFQNKHVHLASATRANHTASLQKRCRGYTSVISGTRRTAWPVECNSSCIWFMHRRCHAFAMCQACTQAYDGQRWRVRLPCASSAYWQQRRCFIHDKRVRSLVAPSRRFHCVRCGCGTMVPFAVSSVK